MEVSHDVLGNSICSSAQSGAAFSSPVHFYITTMGCAKNEVDSAHMCKLLLSQGCLLANSPEEADCIIVNTCSFIQAATEESIETIFEMCALESTKRGKVKVIVAGCMPARYGEDLATSLTEVETFIPCSKEDDIAQIVSQLFPGRLYATDYEVTSSAPSVYIKISDGCDRFCSFCTIPFIRGRYHSYTFEHIHREVMRSVKQGAREIVLIAQDTGRWGSDFQEPSSLAVLMATLAQEFPTTWFRVMYVQPEGVTEELLDTIAKHDNIASYLDVPFQHASARILRDMNRNGSGKEYLKLISSIRQRVPQVSLRTTLIVGFPGEEESDFEELCSFVEEAEFDYVGIFPYSQEEGTRAAQLPSQISEEEKIDRFNTLREKTDALSSARIAQRVGQDFDVLIEGCEEDGQLYGRAQCQAPEVDGLTYVHRGEIGEIRQVRIIDTLMYEMEGE